MELKPGYKQTEVGVIPEDWKVIDISDLCGLQRGFDITEATRVAGTVPVYSSSGLSYFHNKAIVSPPGVVTGRKGILGKVFFIKEPFWPHDTTLWVKDFKGNHPAYVALVLEHFHLERLDAATSVPTLNRNNLVGYPIPHPPNAEQEAIAEALSDADALIESTEQLVAKKRHLEQGTRQELLRPKAGWEPTSLGSIADPNQRWSFTGGPFGSNLKASDYTAEGVRIVQLQNIGDGEFKNEYQVFTSTDKADELLSCNIFPGDIILSKMGDPVARACIVPPDHERYLMCSDGIRLAVNQKRFDTYFCYTAINSPSFRTKAENAGTGSTRKRIGLGELRRFELLCPKLAEQTAIAAILSDMDAEIAALEAKLAKACLIKQGMMHNLLTGRIRLI